MTQTRRSFLFSSLGLFLAGLPSSAWPKPKKPMPEASSTTLAQAIAQATLGHPLVESEQVSLDVPDIAEDGAIVPVTVETDLPGVDAIWVFVEKNPSPLAARFKLAASLDPFVSLRVKMNESCNVLAVVKSGDAYFSVRKPVRVVLGGCG